MGSIGAKNLPTRCFARRGGLSMIPLCGTGKVVLHREPNDIGCYSLLAISMAANRALALFTLSWYSRSGMESCTTPPPA